MPAGEAFTDAQRQEIRRAVEEAEAASGWHFSILVSRADGDSRSHAERLHARLPDPARSIFVHVDPEHRSLDIVTGSAVRRIVTNRNAALVAVTMQSAFAAGDLTRGLLAGVRQFAQLAQQPKSLHTDTP